jgi:hypothetical protein
MLPHDQGLVRCGPVKDVAFAGGGFLGQDIIDRVPIGVLQVKRVDHGIADVQQLRIP